jgi:hypothetical protein
MDTDAAQRAVGGGPASTELRQIRFPSPWLVNCTCCGCQHRNIGQRGRAVRRVDAVCGVRWWGQKPKP